jgi:deoxyribodipyrimidine photo-lyase
MSDKGIAVFWFRRDLRLHDNHALFQALSGGLSVLPVFIFDKNILNSLPSTADKRVAFIHDSLQKLQKELQQVGSSLFILHDKPLYAFEKICKQFEIKTVYTNHDYEPYAIKRDQSIAEFLSSKNIRFSTFKDQVIFEKDEVIKTDGKPYTVYTPYSRKWKERFLQQPPVSYPSEDLKDKFYKTSPFPFPSLEEIGFEKIAYNVPPRNIDESIVSTYEKTRDIPSLNGTSRLGVHLRFGTVSVRELARSANELNQVWLNELIWREFFMMILYHFPSVVNQSFKRKYDNIKWRNNEEEFDRWCKGETGYLMVDAGMRELNETGFMHNRVRMVVASFLTKHLLIDWRWGESYFASKLMDYELASNNGNWQWAAGSGCDAAPYFRIFNPDAQLKKFDPELKYVTKWLGDVNQYMVRPIVQHEFARKRALDVYKAAVKEEF